MLHGLTFAHVTFVSDDIFTIMSIGFEAGLLSASCIGNDRSLTHPVRCSQSFLCFVQFSIHLLQLQMLRGGVGVLDVFICNQRLSSVTILSQAFAQSKMTQSVACSFNLWAETPGYCSKAQTKISIEHNLLGSSICICALLCIV